MRLIGRLAVVLALAGPASACACEAPAGQAVPAPAERLLAPPAAPAPPQALGALPARTPMVTLAVHARSFEVDNRALVDTWPEPDRARADAPYVHAEVPAADAEGLLVPALRAAMQRAMEVERLRAAGTGTPIAFALRVDGDAPWRRVQEAIYAAGQAGWVEPRFVLRAAQGTGEVVLAMPLPELPAAPAPEALQREIAALLEGREPAPAPERIAAPGPAALAITLTGARALELRVRGEPLDRSCARTGEGAPTLPASDGATDIAGLGRCVDAARATEALGVRGMTLAADPALTFDDVAPVLETLRARGEVSLVAGP